MWLRPHEIFRSHLVWWEIPVCVPFSMYGGDWTWQNLPGWNLQGKLRTSRTIVLFMTTDDCKCIKKNVHVRYNDLTLHCNDALHVLDLKKQTNIYRFLSGGSRWVRGGVEEGEMGSPNIFLWSCVVSCLQICVYWLNWKPTTPLKISLHPKLATTDR